MENGSTNVLTKFYYNSRGCDNNGNFGPEYTDPGWVIVNATSYEHALTLLPRDAQVKVMQYVQEIRDEQDDNTLDIEETLQLTCGWGASFTFMDEENWADYSAS